jgi:putative ABC transport system ATP-binding protein
MACPLVDLDDVTKDYVVDGGSVAALRGVTLSVAAGEMIAIMGPSGSGKSTLMHLMGCLDSPTSGSYRFDGADVSHFDHDALARARNRRIGFVFQNFNLLPRIDALDNVALPLLYAGVSAEARRRRAGELLEVVGLSGRAHHRPAQLSGGQQQRVAIARALANTPSLILADEPTGALDTQSSAEVMKILLGLNDLGITIILITHDADVARSAQRVIRLRDGRVAEAAATLGAVA